MEELIKECEEEELNEYEALNEVVELLKSAQVNSNTKNPLT